MDDPVVTGLTATFASDERPVAERERLVRLMALFAALPPPDTGRHFPRYAELQREFRDSFASNDPERIEERFLELYAHLHMHEAPYTPDERRRVDATGG